MKLLLDENLSWRLVAPLQAAYPDTTQVEAVGLAGATDSNICDFAAQNGFVLVTKDEDFDRLVALRGFQPKLIRLMQGNTSNQATLKILLDNADRVISALAQGGADIIELG